MIYTVVNMFEKISQISFINSEMTVWPGIEIYIDRMMEENIILITDSNPDDNDQSLFCNL